MGAGALCAYPDRWSVCRQIANLATDSSLAQKSQIRNREIFGKSAYG
ncbi:hypothetical protein NOR51B_933 [Luminiphilus syltensis NOR5-1B]|uniref:Uncharacterized protein n=1 Tax=Luminiphilus syltensis NOR5-1B TaxID=565045 RepID=B8KX98_9GAMM|nr:hypothetical protein NOR51B_933 [Luminiphilus syltensis NOR5-1B]